LKLKEKTRGKDRAWSEGKRGGDRAAGRKLRTLARRMPRRAESNGTRVSGGDFRDEELKRKKGLPHAENKMLTC
jgi:hypothetical protein